ncbi:Uncharacterized protein GBIM_13740 [Gryllus bimaculatus]|nr:Uncharacterized protein GBIM_13740 [Gryllus bimaculatus]
MRTPGRGQIQELDPDREFFNSDEGKKALESLYSAREVISNLIQQEFGHVRYSTDDTEWRNLMFDMQSTLQATFSFLYDSSKMWERHFSRTKEAKNMINMKLISLIAQHSVTEAELEKEINIAIDSLRQEPTDEKLKYTLHKVYGLLGEIEDQYAKHFAEQQSIIERYSNISEAEIKLLQSEIEEFLNIYPNEYFNDYFLRRQDQLKSNISGKKPEEKDKDESESSNLPHQLRKCHYQTDALRNWKLGLREAILFYQIVCNKELERNMKRWVDKQLNSLTRSFEAKLTVHRSRFQRVKTEIHDLRLAELEAHIQRFESHVLGVQQQTYELSETLQNYFRDITATIIPEFTCAVKDIEDKAKASDSSTDVSSLIVKAESMYSQYNYILNTKLQDFLSEAANKINWIEKTNLNFIKSLKLFSKGGNFHPEEAHVITGELDKLSDDVEKKGAALRKQATEKDASTQRTVKVVSEKLLHGLRSTYEDIHFAEKVTLAIMRVRDFIKKEVKHMKYNRKLLTTKIDEMLTVMPETGGKDILSFITESWHSLLDAAEEHYNLLVQPMPTNENSSIFLRILQYSFCSLSRTIY